MEKSCESVLDHGILSWALVGHQELQVGHQELLHASRQGKVG